MGLAFRNRSQQHRLQRRGRLVKRQAGGNVVTFAGFLEDLFQSALHPLARQFLLQQVARVDLHQHVGKVLGLITLAARIAIDALMRAAAIQIPSVFDAKPRIGPLG
jgi:hypothetical protein